MSASEDIYVKFRMLKDLAINTTDKEFEKTLVKEIEEVSRKLNLCPKCYAQLMFDEWEENRGYIGCKHVTETMSKIYCPFCGWEEGEEWWKRRLN